MVWNLKFYFQTCNILVLGLFFATLLVALPSSFANINKDELQRKVVEFVETGMDCHDNPGLTVSVVRDGKTILARGFGHKTLDKKEAVTNETLFGIASLSKSFAATLILKQIELHKDISLSTKISSIFNDVNIFEDYLRSKYTTIEDLLAHRQGIPSNNNIRFDQNLTRSNLIKRLRYLSPKGGFRRSFYYSNLMYGLITHASEKIGGKCWEDLVTEHLLTPLGMTSTNFVTTANADDIDLVQGYQNRYGELKPVPYEFSRRWGNLCGSGCVLSNANDMAEWMKFHINGGKNNQNETVLDLDILAKAHKSQNSLSSSTSLKKYYTKPNVPVTLTNTNYGLGWRLGHYRGYPIVTHTGSTYGYRAMVLMVPDMNFGIFTALSGDDKDYRFRRGIQLYIADLLLGIDPWLNTTTVCSFPEPWQPKPKISNKKPETDIEPQRNLTSYVGIFEHSAYGAVDIYINKTTNRLMCKYGFGFYVLYPKANQDDFFGQGYGLVANVRDFSTFRFKHENDRITDLEIPSFQTSDPPSFKRQSLQKTNTAETMTSYPVLMLVTFITSVWLR